MTHWIKDAVSAALEVRRLRRIGIKEQLYIMTEGDIGLHDYETAVDRKYHFLLYQCIEDMAHGRSRCRYCEEYPTCKNSRKGNVRGCGDWWLRFLTDEEEKECHGIYEQAAEAGPAEGAEEDQATGIPRHDARGEDRQPDPERDHAGGPEAGMD